MEEAEISPEPLVLYQYPGGSGLPSLSPSCLKVSMALGRLRLPHRVVNLRTVFHARRVSPTGRLPVLEIGGERIVDSMAILDSLEARDADAVLFPRDRTERARDRLWDHFATDSLYWTGVYLRWVVPSHRRQLLEAMFGKGFSPRKLLVGLVFAPMMVRRAKGQGIGKRSRDEVEGALKRSLETIGSGLEAGPYLGGRQTPGRGDLAVASHLAQVGWRGALPGPLEEVRSNAALVEYVGRTFQACGMEKPEGFRD